MPEKKPTRTADLDYFYGQSSELFSFYRIPKLLFQDSRFQPLSTDAKTLYGILLDRMSLSARNGWLDKAGRVFIIYTVQEVQDSLGCADKKATKLLRELEEYGLIERKRRGLGKPDLIYVKNFSSESSKTPYLNRDNDDSGTVQNTLQDPAKLRCNKTERNNTEISDTDPISSDENDWMSEREQLEEYFSQALEVDLLLRLCPDDEDTIYQIVNLLVDTCATNRKLLHIAGDDKPAEVVRSRFTDAQFLHFDFILNCVVKIETLKINFVCTVEVVVNHLFDHGILADSQHSAHLVAVQRTRETGSAVNRRRSSNVEIITLVVMENIADKLPLDHLCQP